MYSASRPRSDERDHGWEQLASGQPTVVGERAEQPRHHQGRRVERQHITDRRQKQRAACHERPSADLGEVSAQHETQCRAEALFFLRALNHDLLDSQKHHYKGKGHHPRSGDGPR